MRSSGAYFYADGLMCARGASRVHVISRFHSEPFGSRARGYS